MNGTKVSFPGLGISFNINNVAFTIGGIEVYWYGILIALGITLCVILALAHCKKNAFSQDLTLDVLLVSIPCAIVGARLYYVLCNLSYYSGDLSKIVDTRSGGLAVYGGVIGAFLGTFIMCKIRRIPLNTVADYCIVYVPLGQAIGRWGNFFNQEAFGTTTNLPWGMTSDKVMAYLEYNCPNLDSTMPVHPTFLYESICTLALFFILLVVRKRSTHAYETTAVYCVIYGIVRFLIESLRTDSLYIGNTDIRTSQLLSAVIAVAGLIYIAVAHTKCFMRNSLPSRFLVDTKVASAPEADSKKSDNSQETK